MAVSNRIGWLTLYVAGGFINLVDQHWVAWLTAILFGVLLFLEIFLLPETLYPRKHMLSQLPTTYSDSNPSGEKQLVTSGIKRTKQLPFLNFQKVPGVSHPKPWDAAFCFLKLWSFPNVAVTVFLYCFAW